MNDDLTLVTCLPLELGKCHNNSFDSKLGGLLILEKCLQTIYLWLNDANVRMYRSGI